MIVKHFYKILASKTEAITHTTYIAQLYTVHPV